MAVTTFKEIHSGRDGDEGLSRDGRRIRRYTRVWRATTDDNDDDGFVVLLAPGCPGIGSVHPTDPTAFLRRLRPRNESFSKRVWIVTGAYSSEQEIEENPLADPAVIEWGTEQFQRVYIDDVNGQAILNEANEPFNPAHVGDDSRVTATIRKNLAVVPAWILIYRDAVNHAPCVVDGMAVATGVAKVQAVHISSRQERNEVNFRVLTLLLHFNPDGWKAKILNQGLRQLVSSNLEDCVDNDGQPVTSPVLLDADGLQLASPSPSNATYIEAEIYTARNFSVLPLS